MANNPNAVANLVPFRTGNDPRRNGNGRPLGRRSLSGIVRSLLESEVAWEDMPVRDKNGYCLRLDRLVPWEAIVYVALGQALSGNLSAMEWLRKAAYGNKVDFESQSKQASITHARKLTITIVRAI